MCLVREIPKSHNKSWLPDILPFMKCLFSFWKWGESIAEKEICSVCCSVHFWSFARFPWVSHSFKQWICNSRNTLRRLRSPIYTRQPKPALSCELRHHDGIVTALSLFVPPYAFRDYLEMARFFELPFSISKLKTVSQLSLELILLVNSQYMRPFCPQLLYNFLNFF